MTFSYSVEYLLSELDKAKKRPPPYLDDTIHHELAFDVHIFELEFGDEKPLSERLGISKRLFVPEPELDDDEVEALVKSILEVWQVFHYYGYLPAGVPPRLVYKTLLSVWNDLVPSVMTGGYHFTFHNPDLDPYYEEEHRDLPF